ncbi:MAG: subclass B3 metallo-beta-lactamase, partial [Sphingorhabdus sp.]
VGGLAGLKEATAAKLVVRAEARASFESGEASDQDPQHGTLPGFGPVAVDQLIRDGENIELGPISMTAIASPGHAPGGTSWTWRSCNEEICYQFVYADSLGAIAGEQYRFSDHPEYVASFRATIDTIGGLSACDVIISPHPSQTAFFERLSGKAPLADPKGCSKYASDARVRLDERLAQERIP